MKMLSRMETSMVRFLILKALMESLHLALGLYRMEQRLEKRLFADFNNCLDAGKAVQQFKLPVREGCTDPSAVNFDPTARSDDGSCLYQF